MADVALAPLDAANAEAIYRWMCDPQVSRNVGLRSEPTLEKTRAFIARANSDDTIFARAVLLDGHHVGNVVIDQIDAYSSTARLSIYIGESSARGRGVGKRAVALSLGVAFEHLALNKVYLTVHARNVAALAVYVAVGFVVEGVHREEFLLDGERVAELYMGVLRSDWVRMGAAN
jgi:RimJ/RimL family protein N-acetyltransferase